MIADHNPATNPTAVFYRRVLVDLDKDRAQLIRLGVDACPTVITALDQYRTAVQEALHTQGVSR